MAESVTTPLTIRLLGPWEVSLGDEPMPRPRSRKGQWLLALLVLRHGTEVARPWLAGLLWPDSSEPAALASLRNSLADLRRVLGPEGHRLRSPTAHTLSLDLAGSETDVVAFDAAVARGDPPALEEAVRLYRGSLLEGCVEEWVGPERARREQAYLAALEQLAAGALAEHDYAAAERCLRRLAAADLTRETAQRALISLLAEHGGYAAALEAYRELCLRLHRELNAEPDAETQALFARIRAEARRAASRPTTNDERPPTAGHRPPGGEREVSGASGAGTAEASSPAGGRSSYVGGRSSFVPAEATVTLLVADIEAGARLWEEQPDLMRLARARHEPVLRDAVESHHGRLIRGVGDACCAAFGTAADAADAALAIQRNLRQLRPSAVGEAAEPAPRVRVVLHTGTAPARDEYAGPAFNRGTRLLELAHGGQVLVSGPASALLADVLPPGATLRDLGTHRLRDLPRPEPIAQLCHPDLPDDFPPLASQRALPNNLPQPVTRFIGRERETAEVKALLAVGTVTGHGSRVTSREADDVRPATRDARLVTITGAGGIGKTRLALQVARERREDFADGVWLVDLAPIGQPALVAQAVATTLGVRLQPGASPAQSVAEHLRSRQLLLVLDNCEHLPAACAAFAEAILRRCPEVAILATSREMLNIAGETTYRLDALASPDPQQWPWLRQRRSRSAPARPALTADEVSALARFDALQLFLDRAAAALPSFAITPENAAVVAEICRRLDGIPLAIELAAVRVKGLPVESIAARLDDRFRLLTGGRRTARPRQQTLRSLIDWSYDLLTEAERALLRRLSVFAGGWTLEAAEAVCARGASVKCEVLSVEREVGDAEALTLNTQHSTLPLAEGDVLDLLTSLLEKSLVLYDDGSGRGPPGAWPRYRLLETVRQYAWERLGEAEEAESARRQHCDWYVAMAERAEPELRGPAQIHWLDRLDAERDNLWAALARCLAEGKREAGSTGTPAEQADIPHPTSNAMEMGLCLFGLLRDFWGVRGHVQETHERLTELLGLTGAGHRTRGRALALLLAGSLADQRMDYPSATAAVRESVALCEAVGERIALAEGLSFLARMAFTDGRPEEAAALWERSMALGREVGDQARIASALNGLGRLAFRAGQMERAARLLEECLTVSRAMDNERMIAWALHSLGRLALNEGDYPRAMACFQEAREMFEAAGDRVAVAGTLLQLGRSAARHGEYARATAWAEEAHALYEELEQNEGRLVREILAEVAWGQGNPAPRVAVYQERLAEMRAGGPKWGLAGILEGLAAFAAGQGAPARAARLYGAAEVARATLGNARPPADQAEYEEHVTAARAATSAEAFAAAWEAGRALSPDDAIRCASEEPSPGHG